MVGGWVIEQDHQHQVASADTIRSFVADSFQEAVSPAWVSRTMQALHLSSHREAIKKEKYKTHRNATPLFEFLGQLRDKIDEGYEDSRVVAVDNVRFTHPSPILRSYSPEGGYVYLIFIIFTSFCKHINYFSFHP